MPIYVLKSHGEKEKYDPEKIRKTVERSGAPSYLIDEIIRSVSSKVYNGIETKEILKMILKLLEKENMPAAAKYDLKGAIMRLGPAGFDFEQFVAEVFKAHGYSTKTDQVIQGACISHEIDIIISKAKDTIKSQMVEVKYHNMPGIFTGSKDILYTYARFLDLVEGYKQGKCQKFEGTWVVTNTKFSADSIQYGICRKITLLGWKYPLGAGLEKMVEEKQLYPITSLRTLDKDSYLKMAKAKLMLCKDLAEMHFMKLQKATHISRNKLRVLVAEARELLGEKEI